MSKFIFLFIIAMNTYANFPEYTHRVIFAELYKEELSPKNVSFKDIEVLETFLFNPNRLKNNEEIYQIKIKTRRELTINKKAKSIKLAIGSSRSPQKTFEVLFNSSNSFTVNVHEKNQEIRTFTWPFDNLAKEYLKESETQTKKFIQHHRGYGELQEIESNNFNTKSNEKEIREAKPKSLILKIKEKIRKKNKFDNTSWKYTPVKIISYPAQKIMYDLPALVSNTLLESVTRSPKHNLLSTFEELKGAGKGFKNGADDVFRGVVSPKNATLLDGGFTIADSGLKLLNVAAGVIKTSISLVGYPLFRLFGGKKSKHVPLRGKRATIVIVDTGIDGALFDKVIDTYGETILRDKLKSISSFYCIKSNAEKNDILDCIDNIPSDIHYIDFFALTHSGGTSEIEFYAEYAQKNYSLKPELLVSIGCYDSPSELTEKENTLGQEETSWAVHFYLSNLISKRLRGIPMEQASREAFYGSIPINLVNPISIGGVLTIGIGEKKIKNGYLGSTPALITVDSIVSEKLKNAWDNLYFHFRNYHVYKSLSKKKSESDRKKFLELLKVIDEIHYIKLTDESLSKQSLKLLKNSAKFKEELLKQNIQQEESLQFFKTNLQKKINVGIRKKNQLLFYFNE